jgi:hypothetical protein
MFNADGQARDNIWDLSKSRITVHPNDALKDLKAYALFSNDKPVTATGYNKWGKYSSDTVRRLFGSWENACMVAGIKNIKKHKYSAKELIIHIEKVAIWRMTRPSIGDLKKYNDIHGSTITQDAYSRRWGGYVRFIQLFSDYKMGKNTEKDLIDSIESKAKRKSISAKTRALILNRDCYACVDCGITASEGAKLQVHHLKPVSHGGTNALQNLVTNCSECNLGKSDTILQYQN